MKHVEFVEIALFKNLWQHLLSLGHFSMYKSDNDGFFSTTVVCGKMECAIEVGTCCKHMHSTLVFY